MRNKILLMGLSIVLAAGLLGGATLAWFSDSAEADAIDMSAGTLMIEAGTTMIYGVEKGTGDIYEIDVDSGNKYILYDRPSHSGNVDWPNGLAFDRQNNRLYYANDASGNTQLMFYDLESGEVKEAGRLGNKIAGATFGQGYYWYVPNSTDDLWRVKFDAQGIEEVNELVEEGFTDSNLSFNFGDLAMDMRAGIIYGSSTSKVFFEIDTRNDYAYQSYSKTGNPSSGLQMAFAADGNLYGHTTHNEDGANWWQAVLDTDTKNVSFNSLAWSQEDADRRHFNDLASNFQNNWNPGDQDPVRYYVTNVGSKTSYVRAIIESYGWDGDLGDQNISFTSETGKWLLDQQNQRGSHHFYYQGILEPGETAEPLFIIVHLDGEGTGDEYQGEEFTMQVKFEAFQTTNGAREATNWNTYYLPAGN